MPLADIALRVSYHQYVGAGYNFSTAENLSVTVPADGRTQVVTDELLSPNGFSTGCRYRREKLPVQETEAGFVLTIPPVPVMYRAFGAEQSVKDLRRIHETTGLRRFFICAPCFNDVMYGPFPDDLYERIGDDIAAYKKGLADTDIEISWWCAPSIRYVAKICSVAKRHPAFICIEDDYTLAWGRGLDSFGACFCARHMKLFSERCGKPLRPDEIVAAFKKQTPENLPVRQAFADGIRDSLVQLARQVRAGVDKEWIGGRPPLMMGLSDLLRMNSQELAFQRDGDGFRPIRRADFREEDVQVFLDDGDADAQLTGDVGVREPAADGLEDLLLACGELGDRRILRHDLLDLHRDIALAGGDRGDGLA